MTTLTRWHSYTNLTLIPWRYTGCAKMNFLRQGFRKLSCESANRQTSYEWSLPVTWQSGGHTMRSAVFENSMLPANLMALSFIELKLWAIKVYIAGIGIFDLFGSCDLDFDPMTFIHKLDPYCPEIHRMCKYELPTLRLSKVIVWQRDRQTDRQTDRIDRNYKPRRFAGGQ